MPVVSVELVLDAASDATIRRDWDALAAAGLSSAGRHTGVSNRPHLSLAVRSGMGDTSPLRAVARMLPLPLRAGGILLFPHDERTVLAREIVVDATLLDLHAAVHRLTDTWGQALPHSAPGEWTPHLTLARRLRVDDLPRALGLLGDGAPASLTAVGVRVWDGHHGVEQAIARD